MLFSRWNSFKIVCQIGETQETSHLVPLYVRNRTFIVTVAKPQKGGDTHRPSDTQSLAALVRAAKNGSQSPTGLVSRVTHTRAASAFLLESKGLSLSLSNRICPLLL